ncbi:putative serine/threonine-protein kinase [Phytophthora ramorum]|uniref:putative serine/threonine-protein kinase n=1 Tax=Phytophthora ramorum TaxID=164328 RepID=UPI00309728ED|nr:putative serine/threonine-protein kinase [Phytophthora ramorum]
MVSAEDPGPAVMGALRRLESQPDGGSSFDLLYLIPIILGALVLLLLLLWLLCRRRQRPQRRSSEQFQVFDTPPMIAALGTPDEGPVNMSPMDPMASFSSLRDAESATKNVWLSGSGRTLNSVKSASSSRSLTASTVADYVLNTAQRDQLFHVLHHDAALATQRLAVDKIAFERVLGETRTRRLWLCQFEGEEIVVKSLNPPERDEQVFPALQNFVLEIQMTAALEHPNVLKFLGVAWGHSLRSLCFVAEFLSRGDLASFLRRCRKRRQQLTLHMSSSSVSDASRGSSSSTTTGQTALTGPSPPPSLQSSGSGFTLTSWVDDKLPIAVGVMRALVYLHTRRPKPIVYRVLRARKVAMSDHFEPKLIDLTPAAGGSPPVDQEEMAAGVGNAFWTAPELLTGGVPTQASDIYAFGVLLAEIDSEAKRPYHTARDTRSGEKLRAFQVLNLVASGELRPHFATNCPPEVREIALACMRQNPMQRPTAREVLQGLQSCAACSAA